MKLLVFHGPEFIDQFENRMAYLRIPEVLYEVHWAEERLDRDLINLIQNDDSEFRKRPRLRYLFSFLVQKGLYQRAQKRFGNASVYMVGPLGSVSILESLSGRQPFEEIVQMLFAGVAREDFIVNREESRQLGELDGEWGVYEKTGPRIIQHPIADQDRLKLMSAIIHTRKITEVLWLGFLENKLENILRQKIGAQLNDQLNFTDSLSSDPKLNFLRNSMLSQFEWS